MATRAVGKWRLLLTCLDGHRYFEDEEGKVAVADESGDTPPETDDGLLWLDRNRPIMFGPKDVQIPLYTPAGQKTRTFATPGEGLGVGQRFGLQMIVWPK